jgi:hypothetical protein
MAQLRSLLGGPFRLSAPPPVALEILTLTSKQRIEFGDRSCPAQIRRMPAWIFPVRLIWSTVVDATGNVPALFIIRGIEIHEKHQADFDCLFYSGDDRDSRYGFR